MSPTRDLVDFAIQVVTTARALVGPMRRLTALAHCLEIQAEKLFASSQMTFACASSPPAGPVRTVHTFFCTGALDPMFRRVKGFCDFVRFGRRLCICVFQSRCFRPSIQRLAPRDVAVCNEMDESAVNIHLHVRACTAMLVVHSCTRSLSVGTCVWFRVYYYCGEQHKFLVKFSARVFINVK